MQFQPCLQWLLPVPPKSLRNKLIKLMGERKTIGISG